MNDAGSTEPIRPATVHRAYGRGASGFDDFVRLIPGYHAHLRMSTTRMGLTGGSRLRLLDVGCGTGASTEALLNAAPGAEVVAVDASADMLAVARRKNWPPHVTFVHSRLETLAENGVQGPFDGIFAAYLVGNLPDAEIGLRRILSLLAPGAPVAVHEYAVADRLASRMRWTLASWAYLIPLARLRCGSADLQRYRTQRVRAADGVEAMTRRMQRAGFSDVRVQTVSGVQQHVVYTFLGRRPDEPDVVGQRRAALEAVRSVDEDQVDAGTGADTDDAPGPEDAGGPDDAGYADDTPDERGGADAAGGPTGGRGGGPQGTWRTAGARGPRAEPRGASEPGSNGAGSNGSAADPDADTPPNGGPVVR